MGKKFGLLVGALLLITLVLVGCSSNNGGGPGSSSTGVVYVVNQGDSQVATFDVDLGTGKLTDTDSTAAAAPASSSIVLSPDGKNVFIANAEGATPGSLDDTISAYTVNNDGTLTASGTPVASGCINPSGMAINAAGSFLFVACKGTVISGTSAIQVFSVSGTTLALISSAPVPVPDQTIAVAVTPDGKFLYAANQQDGTVTPYAVGGDGSLALVNPGSPTVSVGTTPSAVLVDPTGNFLYVANTGSNNVSAFTICDINCVAADGSLTPVAGSPFSAGLGPVAMVASPASKYLFVVDKNSSQVSQFKVSTGSGVLTANSPATVSTGNTPVAVAFRVGTTADTDYVYVANQGSNTISGFALDTTTGLLSAKTPVTTGGQPSAIAAQ